MCCFYSLRELNTFKFYSETYVSRKVFNDPVTIYNSETKKNEDFDFNEEEYEENENNEENDEDTDLFMRKREQFILELD